MKRKLKQNIALFSTLALLMTPGVVLAADPTPTPTPSESPAVNDKVTLTLDKTKLELTVGETATITATVTNATDTSVSWSSSPENGEGKIAKLDNTNNMTTVTALKEGSFEITAKSNAGDVYARCSVIVKPKNINIEITSLNLTVGTLDKTFNNGNKDYTITIPEDVNTLNLFQTITLNVDKKAAGLRVTGDSNLVNSSVIQVFVNGETEARHTFTIIKEKKQPVDLSLKSLRVTGYTLDQAFDPNTLNYTLTIPYEAQDVTIQAAAASSEASVSVSGATGLEVGKSVVTVTVSDADGNKREYKITVTREAETEENEEEEENISSTSSSTSNQTSKDVHEDNRKDRTLQYVLVSIGCLILFLIGGFGIYFYIKTSKKKKGNGKDKDKKGNNNQEEQSTTDKEMTSASTNDSSTATSNQADENQSNTEEENSTASQAETELSEEESKRLSELEETKEFYLDKEKKKIEPTPKEEKEEKRKDDVLKDIEELFDDD